MSSPPPSKRQKMESETTTPPSVRPKSGADQQNHKSDAELVREFTAGAGQPTPERPELMSKNEVTFLGKMLLDEILELYATVMPPEEAVASLKANLDQAKRIPQIKPSDERSVNIIAEQVDALVDIYYYSLNAAAKKGQNMSRVFQVVHAANMAKRDPATGQFLKRADGKIIKPKGWLSPDIDAEVESHLKNGSFPQRS
eukprot:gb/GEZN01012785.1/.p1 GENE.gb/GEZN01012785.1/~~gb/GEZN01012785.1/.p1  ORF type:complete len:199 (-),score=37.95 gb/GEZN01012785.1/:429-1025(-)